MSNADRLKEAGIIPHDKTLSQEQQEAIDGLSEDQVDELIAINEQLGWVSTDDPIIDIPGRMPSSQD
jgi:hypothetical protein